MSDVDEGTGAEDDNIEADLLGQVSDGSPAAEQAEADIGVGNDCDASLGHNGYAGVEADLITGASQLDSTESSRERGDVGAAELATFDGTGHDCRFVEADACGNDGEDAPALNCDSVEYQAEDEREFACNDIVTESSQNSSILSESCEGLDDCVMDASPDVEADIGSRSDGDVSCDVVEIDKVDDLSNCDNSSTESGAKGVEEIENVDRDLEDMNSSDTTEQVESTLEGGYVEQQNCRPEGDLEIQGASCDERAGDLEAEDRQEDMSHFDEGKLLSGGSEVCYEPECDQSPGENPLGQPTDNCDMPALEDRNSHEMELPGDVVESSVEDKCDVGVKDQCMDEPTTSRISSESESTSPSPSVKDSSSLSYEAGTSGATPAFSVCSSVPEDLHSNHTDADKVTDVHGNDKDEDVSSDEPNSKNVETISGFSVSENIFGISGTEGNDQTSHLSCDSGAPDGASTVSSADKSADYNGGTEESEDRQDVDGTPGDSFHSGDDENTAECADSTEDSAVDSTIDSTVDSAVDSPVKSASCSGTASEVDSKDASEFDDQLLCELDAMLEDDQQMSCKDVSDAVPNGFRQELPTKELMEQKELLKKYDNLLIHVTQQEKLIKSLHEEIIVKDKKLESLVQRENTREKHGPEALQPKAGEDVYLAQIKELEYTIAHQQKEIKQGKDKLASHDAAAKRTVSSLQNELKLRVDQVTKMYQDGLRDKDQMVVKYAQSEQKNLELQKTIEKLESKLRDHVKDREVLIGKLKGFNADKSKLSTQLQNKHSECNAAIREVEKYKDMVSSQDVKVKWAQNKLKAELEAHKETKGKLEKMHVRLKEAKEETEQIRKNCQEMIITYQESEEIKSNSLDQQLKEKLTQLQQQQKEHQDKEEVHKIVIAELDTLKRKHKDSLEESKTLRDKVICLEQERTAQNKTLQKYEDILQKQKKDNREVRTRLQDLEEINEECERLREENCTLKHHLEEMRHTDKETQQDVMLCRDREKELLELTQKLTDKNAHLLSENTCLSTKLHTLASEQEEIKKQCDTYQKKIATLSEELAEEKRMRNAEIDLLTNRLDEKVKSVEALSRQVEEEKDENKTIRRKHTANMKDLTRQLQQARRKLESLEQAGDKDSLSQGSRTSSTGSLDTINGQHSSSSPSTNSSSTSRASSQEPQQPDPSEPPQVRHIEPDRQMMIERIVKLQKAHARKNEKLEFLDDHNHQLLEEIKKKSKIIQNYILREEAGALAPASMDQVKAQMSKKGGIMASVYNSQAVDGGMTLELSLEINRKLQAVLEDTLLKNITLKDNLDTLGAEIARLSQENRTIQLQMKGHKS